MKRVSINRKKGGKAWIPSLVGKSDISMKWNG